MIGNQSILPSLNKHCLECGTIFFAKKKHDILNKTLCSRACSVTRSLRVIRSKTFPKECVECHVSFISKTPRAKYCSEICKRKPEQRKISKIIYVKNCIDCDGEMQFSYGNARRKGKRTDLRCNVCARKKWQTDKCGNPQIPWWKRNKQRLNKDRSIKSEDLRLEMIAAYGGKCVHCGIKNPIVLALDHINDDGTFERLPSGKRLSGINFYSFLKKINWPKDRLQLLCYNCNFQKEYIRRKILAGNPTKLLGYGDIS